VTFKETVIREYLGESVLPRVLERLVRNHLEKAKKILLNSIDEGKIIA